MERFQIVFVYSYNSHAESVLQINLESVRAKCSGFHLSNLSGQKL